MLIIGLDLGQSGDPAAAAVLDRNEAEPENLDTLVGPPNPFVGKIFCRSLKVWPLNTDYCDIIDSVLGLPFDVLVPDFCGVGRPVVDMLRRRAKELNIKGSIRPVTTVGSNVKAASTKMEARGLRHSVPKIELATSIIVCQQQKRLVLPATEETKLLMGQLADYQVRYSKAANLQFGNVDTPGAHDDLVTALGLGCWWSLRFGTRRLSIFTGPDNGTMPQAVWRLVAFGGGARGPGVGRW